MSVFVHGYIIFFDLGMEGEHPADPIPKPFATPATTASTTAPPTFVGAPTAAATTKKKTSKSKTSPAAAGPGIPQTARPRETLPLEHPLPHLMPRDHPEILGVEVPEGVKPTPIVAQPVPADVDCLFPMKFYGTMPPSAMANLEMRLTTMMAFEVLVAASPLLNCLIRPAHGAVLAPVLGSITVLEMLSTVLASLSVSSAPATHDIPRHRHIGGRYISNAGERVMVRSLRRELFDHITTTARFPPIGFHSFDLSELAPLFPQVDVTSPEAVNTALQELQARAQEKGPSTEARDQARSRFQLMTEYIGRATFNFDYLRAERAEASRGAPDAVDPDLITNIYAAEVEGRPNAPILESAMEWLYRECRLISLEADAYYRALDQHGAESVKHPAVPAMANPMVDLHIINRRHQLRTIIAHERVVCSVLIGWCRERAEFARFEMARAREAGNANALEKATYEEKRYERAARWLDNYMAHVMVPFYQAVIDTRRIDMRVNAGLVTKNSQLSHRRHVMLELREAPVAPGAPLPPPVTPTLVQFQKAYEPAPSPDAILDIPPPDQRDSPCFRDYWILARYMNHLLPPTPGPVAAPVAAPAAAAAAAAEGGGGKEEA